jgi:hypothetical protein
MLLPEAAAIASLAHEVKAEGASHSPIIYCDNAIDTYNLFSPTVSREPRSIARQIEERVGCRTTPN